MILNSFVQSYNIIFSQWTQTSIKLHFVGIMLIKVFARCMQCVNLLMENMS